MDMKLKRLIDDGATLNDLGSVRGSQVSRDLINYLTTDKGAQLRTAFKKNFFSFIGAFEQFYPDTLDFEDFDKDWSEGLEFFLRTPQAGSEGLLYDIKDNINHKHEKAALALLENAFTYATANTFKLVIPPMYMRAKQPPYGTQPAMYPESTYAGSVEKEHPLLATFVRGKNKLLDQKILAIIGYMLHPYGIVEE